MMLLPVLLVLAGLVLGVAVMLRSSTGRHDVLEANPMTARVVGEVHAGEEQVLIHLARTLDIATGRAEVGYGEIYVAGSAGTTMKLASRSEIGRGFDGEVRVRRTRRSTIAEYFILRLPGDDTINRRIARLDEEIAASLRALDPAAQVRTLTDQQHRRPRGFTTSRAS